MSTLPPPQPPLEQINKEQIMSDGYDTLMEKFNTLIKYVDDNFLADLDDEDYNDNVDALNEKLRGDYFEKRGTPIDLSFTITLTATSYDPDEYDIQSAITHSGFIEYLVDALDDEYGSGLEDIEVTL